MKFEVNGGLYVIEETVGYFLERGEKNTIKTLELSKAFNSGPLINPTLGHLWNDQEHESPLLFLHQLHQNHV